MKEDRFVHDEKVATESRQPPPLKNDIKQQWGLLCEKRILRPLNGKSREPLRKNRTFKRFDDRLGFQRGFPSNPYVRF